MACIEIAARVLNDPEQFKLITYHTVRGMTSVLERYAKADEAIEKLKTIIGEARDAHHLVRKLADMKPP